jgi:hypothetical protein
VDCEGPSRSSPLHLACSRGNHGALRALISGGANIEAQGWNRERPLHIAARKGRRETCMLLLELGADPDALDGMGRRPWQVAESQFAGLTTPKGALGACSHFCLGRLFQAYPSHRQALVGRTADDVVAGRMVRGAQGCGRRWRNH